MAAYYNEIDAYAAEWLRNLIKAGHIADGEVDTRSIVDVEPDDLRRFDQCHFFAGIAGWSHALRLAGWSDDRKIWTGSCPCQPFSVAGQGKGVDDERHLWPHFFRLIRGCRPPVVMGEQVAGAAGYGWLDGVRSDLESESYACDGVDIPACAANAPHIRSRLYWVAMDNTQSKRLERRFDNSTKPSIETRNSNIGTTSCDSHDMADADCEQLRGGHAREPIIPSSSNEGEAWERQRVWVDAGADGDVIASDMADTQSIGRRQGTEDIRGLSEGNRQEGTTRRFTVNNYSLNVANADDAGRQGRTVYAKCSDEQSAWSQSVEWRRGADGKTRRVKSGLCLLAHGVPARVGKLRAYGNAIVPPLAAEVIKAFMETL